MTSIMKLRKQKAALEKKVAIFNKKADEKEKLERETAKLRKEINESKTKLRQNIKGKFLQAKKNFKKAARSKAAKTTIKSIVSFAKHSEKAFNRLEKKL